MKTVFSPAQPFYRIGEAEAAYAASAARGMVLQKAGKRFDRYHKERPQKLRYRLEFFQGEGPDEEQLELYEGAGWKLVSFCNGRAVFVTGDPDAPELYSDPESELAMLRSLRRARLADGVSTALGALAYGLMLTVGDRGLYQVLAISNCIVVLAFLVLALLLCQGVYGIVRLSRLIGRIKRGQSVPHDTPAAGLERAQRVLCLVLWAAAMVTVVLLFVEAWEVSRKRPLPESAAGAPWFEAADVLEGYHRMTAEEGEHYYISAENTIKQGGTWFYPVYCSVDSYAARNDAAGYSFDGRSFYLDYYRARNAELAEKLAWDLAEHSIWRHKNNAPQVLEDDRFDLVLSVSTELQRIYLRGDQIYDVTYIGANGDWPDAIAQMVDQKMSEGEK